MKFSRYFVTFSLMLLVFGCSKDEQTTTPEIVGAPEAKPDEDQEPIEPEREVYFEAVIGDYLYTDLGDHWLLVHDERGALIDYKSFEGNETVVFETTTDSLLDSFTVTYFHFLGSIPRAAFRLHSYTDVAKGTSWMMGIDDPSASNYVPPVLVGSFDIMVSGDFAPPTMQVISNSEGNGPGNGAFSITTNSFSTDWVYETEAELFEKNDYYLTLMNGFGDTKYYYLPDVQNQSVYNLEYDSFVSFDSGIAMTLPLGADANFSLRCYPGKATRLSDPGYDFYSVSDRVGKGISSFFTLGYPRENFSSYSFGLSSRLDDYSYNFSYFGEQLPNEIVVPARPSFSVINSSIFDFDISTDLSYTRRVSNWSYNEGFNDSNERRTFWTVSSPSNTISVIGDLPEEIMTMYPEIKIAGIEYLRTTLLTNSITHTELTNNPFGTNKVLDVSRTLESFDFYD